MTNPYLEGAMAPLMHEHTLTDLVVRGSIPTWLDGRYLRNGPNPVGEIDPAFYNWFLGDGMVHGMRIRDGKAEWYRNCWVRTPAVATALGESTGRGSSNLSIVPNTNVIGHAGRTYAVAEAGVIPYELTDELETVGACDFDGTLRGGYTAHPKRDPVTGELHAVSYSFDRGRTVQYSVIGLDGHVRRTVDIAVTGSPMMHDFSLTENYVVFYDLPVTFDAAQAVPIRMPTALRGPARLVASAILGRVSIPNPIAARLPHSADDRRMPYRWNPDYPARIGVMPRNGDSDDTRWFEVKPCYVFHPMNAYEERDTIVIDLVRHDRMFDTDLRGPNEGLPTLDRWTVDLLGNTVNEERLDDRGQEFPRVDERKVGRRHRYGYVPAITEMTEGSGVLLKHDFDAGTSTSRSFGAGTQVSEFVFEPATPDSDEDDGVLMGYVFHRDTQHSDLSILDAHTLESVATIEVPHRIPTGFHGDWIPTPAS